MTRTLTVVSLGMMIIAAPVVAQDMVALDFAAQAWSIYSGTGAALYLRPLGYLGVECMAKDSGSIAYSVDYFSTQILTIDPASGMATAVTPIVATTSAAGIRALAFGPNGLLYAATPPLGPSIPTLADRLLTISPTTGVASFVGNITEFLTGAPIREVRAMAFSPSGVLYAWGRTQPTSTSVSRSGLITISTLSAAALFAAPATAQNDTNEWMETLAFAPNGTLVGASGYPTPQRFFGIDLASGGLTLVGTTIVGQTPLMGLGSTPTFVTGMEFVGVLPPWAPSIVCHPSTSAQGVDLTWTVMWGTPGNVYGIVTAALNAGNAPNGWFFGIDITSEELAFEVMMGPPFFGFLDANGRGSASLFVPGLPFCNLGLTLDCVAFEVHPAALRILQISPALSFAL